ncbi:hypothetical protein BDZ89DRAFT_901466, partial [Hymenopellis radicata]
DILCIQEPHFNFFGNASATSTWHMILPPSHSDPDDKRVTRSLIMVNKRVATGSWRTVPIPTPDATAILLTFPEFDLIVVNIYN